MKLQVYLFFFSLFLVGCHKPQNVADLDDINELEEFFYNHQAGFNELASTACTFKKNVGLGFYRFIADAPATYPEHLEKHATQMATLLSQIRVKEIMLFQASDSNCSLFIKKWIFLHSEGGSHMGYIYQPLNFNEFNPDVHEKDKRDIKTRIYFTKELTDGWYIEYLNEP